ncbi:hypothetical protein Tsubulata_016318 [Turnera subulata]|uniref:Uncharacterized protein n=1 Tax=Turnera subulata TaxID=218843 RepID=A0A9Q0J2C5_9ROSI|nr:hypothetical protein Tsubulata_016318 [Turnera subulata]
MSIISLKAVIDEANNRVLFVQAGHDFVDTLFSFLTMPLGEIIRLLRGSSSVLPMMGGMGYIYNSVENLDQKHFWSETCRTMLLQPRNGYAIRYCKELKLELDNGMSLKHYNCSTYNCKDSSASILLSYYSNVTCCCGRPMKHEITKNYFLGVEKNAAVFDCGGVFVTGLVTSFIVSDELQVIPPSTEAGLKFLSKLPVMDEKSIVQRSFDVGVKEVRNTKICANDVYILY